MSLSPLPVSAYGEGPLETTSVRAYWGTPFLWPSALRNAKWSLRPAMRVKNDVVRVAGTGACVHLTGPPSIECDLPALAQQRCHIGGSDVVGRVESVSLGLLNVDIGMVDNKKMSKGGR